MGDQYAPIIPFPVEYVKGSLNAIGELSRVSDCILRNYKIQFPDGMPDESITYGPTHDVDRHIWSKMGSDFLQEGMDLQGLRRGHVSYERNFLES